MEAYQRKFDDDPFVMEGILVKPSTNELIVGQQATLVEDKVMKVLVYLVKNRARIVSREELFSNLWPGVFVTQDSLTRCISIIRKFWNEHSQQKQVVLTIRNRGYRIIGKIESFCQTKTRPISNGFFHKVKYVASGVALTLGMISLLILFYCVL